MINRKTRTNMVRVFLFLAYFLEIKPKTLF